MIQNLLETTRRDGGATVDLLGASPKTGYQVGIKAGNPLIIANAVASQNLIDEWVASNVEILSRPDHYVGTWIDSGRIYLDVSVNVLHFEDALTLALANDQIAIWDVVNSEEVTVVA